MMRIYLW